MPSWSAVQFMSAHMPVPSVCPTEQPVQVHIFICMCTAYVHTHMHIHTYIMQVIQIALHWQVSGGALYSSGIMTQMVIKDSSFSRNTATIQNQYSEGGGGGVCVLNGMATILGCTFLRNSVLTDAGSQVKNTSVIKHVQETWCHKETWCHCPLEGNHSPC